MSVLVIGSTVVDVILNVKKMPLIGEDENVISQTLSIGGCAYNVAHTLRYLKIDNDLFSPVGQGIYGDFVKNDFYKNQIPILLESLNDNGCCYCIVDQSGERTFLALHGAEYIFKKEWFQQLHDKSYDAIYVCGLELEEQSGQFILDFLKSRKEPIYFAPSSRIHYIQPSILNDMFHFNPIIHLSQNEILTFMKLSNIEEAAKQLYLKTQNLIIVTLGENGCYFYDGKNHYIPGYKSDVVDTIGAGDCHIASFIAYKLKGLDNEEALSKANYLSSLVVKQKGANLNTI